MKKVLSLTTLMAGAMMVFNAAAADAPKELNLGILGGQRWPAYGITPTSATI